MRLDPSTVQWDGISLSNWPAANGTVNAPNLIHSGVGATWSGAANVKILISKPFTKSCGQDFRRRGGGDGVPFTASPAVGIKNLHVMLIGKPLTFYLVVMLLTL
jgi:hypothetical protein